ncbi:hypothetical protein J2Z83_002123 [Virgibacillus natechei]|uniref:Fur-regulated basic protein FbpA n=1 Tax=Virgibacillus natechei TaxID=1216297 RepID=A0ABS4IGE2_9BACI|nr:hypothetical protein [Virgibacillus natechei]MBP1970015.1 hypothetical protein [Virgibacillus natechei]UZD13328.1 hypothetical protein OLD84_01830 [Virgibacillus natechei]
MKLGREKPLISIEEQREWLEHESQFRRSMMELTLRQIEIDCKLNSCSNKKEAK